MNFRNLPPASGQKQIPTSTHSPFASILITLSPIEMAAYTQIRLGVMHQNGNGVPQNLQEAEKQFQLAASSNTKFALIAKYYLGTLYLNQNKIEEGMLCLIDCAEQGYALAQVFLGDLFCKNNLNIPPQFWHAKHFYELAASQRNESNEIEIRNLISTAKTKLWALQNAESHFQNGLNQLKNQGPEWAKASFEVSAQYGHPGAQSQLALIQLKDKAKESEQAAIGNLMKSASQNEPEGLYYLGIAFMNSIGIKENTAMGKQLINQSAELGFPLAIKHIDSWKLASKYYTDGIAHKNKGDVAAAAACFEVSANAGHTDAICQLANILLEARTPESIEKAIVYLKKAAEQGVTSSMYNLGVAYLHGRGVTQNFTAAKIYFESASKKNHAASQYSYALFLLREQTRESNTKGISLIQQSAQNGFAKAQFRLGTFYEYGNGMMQDFDMALRYYQLAAQGGYRPAQEKLK